MSDSYGETPDNNGVRAKRDAWLKSQLDHYGQERYDQILQAIETISEEVCRWADPLVDEARSRNFLEFGCRVDYKKSATTIRMEFGDPKGNYYVRSFGLDKLMRLHGCPLLWETFISNKVHSYVLGKPGMKLISGRMKKLNRSELSKLPTAAKSITD